MNVGPDGAERFPSKRDVWLVALIWLACVIAVLVSFGAAGGASAGGLQRPVFVVIGLVCAAFMLWVLYGTNYVLTRGELLIRSGPFRFRLALREIDTVTATRDPRSSPACSLDRLKIRYRNGRRWIMISPPDHEEFYRALLRRCSHLVHESDGLVSRSLER